MIRWVSALLVMLMTLHGVPVAAQMVCGIHASMIAKLQMRYSETRRSSGLAGPSALVETWASAEPPYTWTILEVYPSGLACIMAAGASFRAYPIAPKGDPI